MVKVEAVVIRERVETVIDAVEDETGHVGVTVIEAIGHGRERGITHEYRGRVFESRFLPKAVLTFVVAGRERGGRGRRDRRRGAERQRVGRRAGLDDARSTTSCTTGPGSSLEEVEVAMTTKELAIATSTVWVVLAAVLVMFMQAGFAFLEAGLTRMKNVGHIAAQERARSSALASVVYYLVGFGIAFGDGGNGLVGGSGFFPSIESCSPSARRRSAGSRQIPGAAGYMFEVVFAASRSRSSGARWPSGRSSGSTSPSASSSR